MAALDAGDTRTGRRQWCAYAPVEGQASSEKFSLTCFSFLFVLSSLPSYLPVLNLL